MNIVKFLLVTCVSFLFVLITMPQVIPYLIRLKFGQVEREEGLASHKVKNGTPTMGGTVFIIAIVLSIYLCNIEFIKNPYINILTYVILGYGLIGFIDDYLIVMKHNNKGLRPLYKYALQSILAIGFYALSRTFIPDFSTSIVIPIANIKLNLSWFYPIFVYFMFTATSNAVNLADGLDGLATGLSLIAVVPYIIFALANKNIPVALYGFSVLGGLLGFLYFNAHPAQIFMGDCGSLALGGLLAAFAVLTKQELLLILIAIVPLLETLSVIIQVVSFKTRGKRVFKMTPIHHHFEMCGWSETKVVYVFWLVGFIACILGILLGVLYV